MASGIVQDGAGRQVTSASNSCADVLSAYNAFFNGAWTGTNCDADPIIVGSSLAFGNNVGAYLGTSIAQISATSASTAATTTTTTTTPPPPLPPIDWSKDAHVLQAIYWTLIFVLAIYGYSVGSRTAV